MIQFKSLLSSLESNHVQFVIIGGVAATLHGAARVTFDLDIVYERTPENLNKLVDALSPFEPYLRGAPLGLPFKFDAETLRRGLNFTFTTTEGPIDLLGELLGVGSYSDVVAHSVEALLFGASYRFLDLEALLASKRAAGRPKDLAQLPLIRATAAVRKRL